MKLDEYVGKFVDVICYDGREYTNHYVFGFTPHYDNYDPVDHIPDEDSIEILPNIESFDGVGLFSSEIKSITVID